MGYAFRTCFVDHDGSLQPVSAADYNRLAGGALSLPRFAGKTVRSVHLAVEVERGRPTGWVHEDYVMVSFGPDGTVSRGDALLRVRLALADRPDLGARPSAAAQEVARRAITSLARPPAAAWRPDDSLRARILALTGC